MSGLGDYHHLKRAKSLLRAARRRAARRRPARGGAQRVLLVARQQQGQGLMKAERTPRARVTRMVAGRRHGGIAGIVKVIYVCNDAASEKSSFLESIVLSEFF